jgi:hypothetical protein
MGNTSRYSRDDAQHRISLSWATVVYSHCAKASETRIPGTASSETSWKSAVRNTKAYTELVMIDFRVSDGFRIAIVKRLSGGLRWQHTVLSLS